MNTHPSYVDSQVVKATGAMPRRQAGFGVGCFFLTVAFIVIVVVLSVKLVPTFLEDQAIIAAMERVAEKNGIRTMPQRRIVRELRAEADFDGVQHINFEKALTTRTVDGRRELRVNYEVAIPLYRNVALLLDFDHRKLSD